MSTSVETYPDSAALVAAAGERLAEQIVVGGAVARAGADRADRRRHRDRHAAHLGEHGGGIDWSEVHLFWGDDRFVPEDDDERNDKQARVALLDQIDIPAENVHPMAASDGEFGDDIDAAAQAYERELAAQAEPGEPAPDFDVHLLGMGPEGHINSLFPHTEAVREKNRLVVAVEDSPKPPPRRITLTLPAIQRSREVWLIVSGPARPTRWPPRSAAPIPTTCPRPARSDARPPCGSSTRPPRPSSSCRRRTDRVDLGHHRMRLQHLSARPVAEAPFRAAKRRAVRLLVKTGRSIGPPNVSPLRKSPPILRSGLTFGAVSGQPVSRV